MSKPAPEPLDAAEREIHKLGLTVKTRAERDLIAEILRILRRHAGKKEVG